MSIKKYKDCILCRFYNKSLFEIPCKICINENKYEHIGTRYL